MTAAVFAVGISAAGVKTLDIVPQPSPVPGARGAAQALPGPDGAGRRTLPRGLAAQPAPAPVATAPVTPKVREVAVVSRRATRSVPVAGQRRTTGAPRGTAAGTAAKAPRAVQNKPLVALSAPQPVRGYATVGVTWNPGVSFAGGQLSVQVRTEKAGAWSGWQPLDYHVQGPDSDTGELTSRARPGTDALVIGEADRVQMRAETADGRPVPGLRLAVIDPGAGKMVTSAPAYDTSQAATASPAPTGTKAGASTASDAASLSAMAVAPRPYIYSRAQWGANEKLREQGPPDYGTVRAGFIHHTVNANDYTAEQVPALLRGIYAYHVVSRGWRDIGYNFLVDRFGRIWEGRYGGVTRAVIGAHTPGYNDLSFAGSAIGNYDIAAPSQAVLNAFARLFAWKLSLSGIRATATRIWLRDKYVNAIGGHRDVNPTICPGRYLYAKLPYIRALAQRIQDAGAAPPAPTPPPTPTPPTPPPPSGTFTSPTQAPLTWTTQASGITFPPSSNLAGSPYPDLVLKRPDGAIRVLPTDGQLGFRAPVTTAGRWSSMNLVTAAGDLTGDGSGDVLARTAQDSVTRVYRGDGAGHVSIPGVAPTRIFQWATSIVAAGDWNGDGRADVLMRDKFSRLWLLRGRGDGTFVRGVLLSGAFGGWRSYAVAGDLTGDGRPDLVGIHRTGVLYLLASTPTGALAAPRALRRVGTLYDRVLGGGRDATGDRYGDVVVSSSRTGSVAVIAGTGSGRLGATYGWFTAAKGLTSLSAGPMTGTSRADLVGVGPAGLVTLPDNGRSNAGSLLPGNLTRPDATQVLRVGDWNGDGRGDVITREGGGDVLVLHRGLGNGSFVRPLTMARGWRTIRSLAAVGDVTGDRRPDLAGRTSSGRMVIFPGNGAYGFLAPRTAPASLRTFNQIGPGSWRPAESRSAWLGSDGSFVPLAASSGGDPAAYDWLIGPGDVDGDGRPDLVGRDSSGTLWLLPGTGTASLGPRRFLASGYGGYQLGG